MANGRGNYFASIESKFIYASKETIKDIAVHSAQDVVDKLGGIFDKPILFTILMSGVKWGIYSKRAMNADEKRLFDRIFGRIYPGPLEEIYDLVSVGVKDSDRKGIGAITQLGNEVAMPYLDYILAFAYIDGKITDKHAKELENIFAMNLLFEFTVGGRELSFPDIEVSELEAEILNWLKNENSPFLNDIQEHFSNHSKSEIQDALNSLEQKKIIYSVDTFTGEMYGLIDMDIQVNNTHKNKETPGSKAKSKNKKTDSGKKTEKKKTSNENLVKSSNDSELANNVFDILLDHFDIVDYEILTKNAVIAFQCLIDSIDDEYSFFEKYMFGVVAARIAVNGDFSKEGRELSNEVFNLSNKNNNEINALLACK